MQILSPLRIFGMCWKRLYTVVVLSHHLRFKEHETSFLHMDWPPHNPNLSLIENLWVVLQKTLHSICGQISQGNLCSELRKLVVQPAKSLEVQLPLLIFPQIYHG